MSFLGATIELWERQITAAKDAKKRDFGDTAEEAWKYLGDPLDRLREDSSRRAGGDEAFHHATRLGTARLNKSKEFVDVMVPHILGHTPHRRVSTRVPHLPEELLALIQQSPGGQQSLRGRAMEAQAARLLEWWLNYLSSETNLFTESRAALPEALVKGRGTLWMELVETQPDVVMPGAFYDSVDNLLIDPDCRRLNDASFIVRKRTHPAWRLEEMYGVPRGKLRAAYTSRLQHSTNQIEARYGETSPESMKSDVVEYYEVFSRMGLGRKLRDAPDLDDVKNDLEGEAVRNLLQAVEALGFNIRLLICPGMKVPLNLPEHIMTGPDAVEEIKDALRWPIPFHADRFNPWPLCKLDFCEAHDNPWAVSPIRSALPIQRFLDHALTYCMARVRRSSRAILAVPKELGEEFDTALHSPIDMEIVKVDRDLMQVKDLVRVIEFPELKNDLLQMISVASQIWEQLTGMSPLLQGSTQRAMRSATEAQGMQAAASSRPDDYAQCAEDWQSDVARKSAIASRLFVSPRTINTLFREEELGDQGPMTQLWTNHIATDDEVRAAAEWKYDVEAGSARRKNKQKLMDDAQQLTQTLMPAYMQLAMSGVVEPVNALLDVLGDAMDLPLDKMKLSREMIPPPEPQAQSKESSRGQSA